MNVYVNRHGIPDVGIVFQRGLMQFWIPSNMQKDLPYNPKHLPVVQENKHEDILLYLSIRRILNGYRAHSIDDSKRKYFPNETGGI